MVHPKQHIVDLVELCRLKKIKHVIISPGSRNAELIRLFTSSSFLAKSIVDERSAGYYAIGITRYEKQPVVLVCTSGTAVLNYAPAIAEAYYQRIPLIIITADRPPKLIDQQDNQTIRQVEIYKNYIKDSLNLPEHCESPDHLSDVHSSVDKIINCALMSRKGPVHINIPLVEPLYGELPPPSPKISVLNMELHLEQNLPEKLTKAWNSGIRKMILCGEQVYDETLNAELNTIADNGLALVLAESISNIKGDNIIDSIDRVMMQIEDLNTDDFKPGILISMGGQIVSKRLKNWLRKMKNLEHWRITEEEDQIDTYHNVKGTVKGNVSNIMRELVRDKIPSNREYILLWNSIYKKTELLGNEFIQEAPFSDLTVFGKIIPSLPENCYLHLANSSPIRYAQLFNLKFCKQVHSNRGVSGIDGSLSTACGFASVSDNLNVVIIGDLSFVYDSNALWNRELSGNIRVIVINNEGGGIFRLIPGPSAFQSFEAYQEAFHPVKIRMLTEAFGVSYYFCDNLENLPVVFKEFINSGNKPSLLEIKTPKDINPEIFKDYIQKLKLRHE